MGRLTPKNLARRDKQSALVRDTQNPTPKRLDNQKYPHPPPKQRLPRPPEAFTRFLDNVWRLGAVGLLWLLHLLRVVGIVAGVYLLVETIATLLSTP